VSDRRAEYDGEVGYCEGHAVFNECGDDDGDATASDDIRCVHEGHDGRHNWQNEGVSELAGGKRLGDELDVEKMKTRRLRRRLSLMPWISRRGSKMRDRSARTSAVGERLVSGTYELGQKRESYVQTS